MSELKFLIAYLVIAGAWGLGSLPPLQAHPFHTTTAEMEYNSESGRFEVTVKVPASDLEEALTRQALQGAKSKSPLNGSQAAHPDGSVKRVTLDGTPEVERLIVAYLKTRFFLTLAGDNGVEIPSDVVADEKPSQSDAGPAQRDSRLSRSSLHWVGTELDRSSAWLYFELEPPRMDKLSLSNQLFFELNAQQINTCTLRTPAAKFALRTDARQPEVALPPQARVR